MYKYCVIYTKDAITFMDFSSFFFTLLCLGYHRVTEPIGLFLNHERDNRKINFQKSLGKWFLKCIYIVYFRRVLEMRTVIGSLSYVHVHVVDKKMSE